MSRVSFTSDGGAVEASWHNLEQQLDDLLQLARTSPSAADFQAALLAHAAQAVAARAGILWKRSRNSDSSHSASTNPSARRSPLWEFDSIWGADREELFSRSEDRVADHARMVQTRLDDSRNAPMQLDQAGGNREDPWWSAVVPINLDERLVAVLEIFWPQAVPASMHRNIANLLAAFVEAAAEYYRRNQLHDLQQLVDEGAALDAFALRVQRLVSQQSVWFTVANEFGRLIECDRVAVLTKVNRWQIRALSHLDSLDRRSPVVRSVERLAAGALQEAQSIWLHTTSQVDSFPIASQWHSYLEETSARSVALIPLTDPGRAVESRTTTVIGALLVERFAEKPFTTEEQFRIERIARHTAAALARVAELQRSSLWSKILRKSTVLFLLLTACVVGAAFIPIDFEISARGELQPVSRQEVFAPADGLVRQLHVREGQQVAQGENLLELTNDELNFEVTRLAGELQTARQQLVTVQSARLESSASPPPAGDQRGQLAAEEERLKQVIRGLEQQHEHLLQRREELKVRSPIAGRVVTANLDQMLRSRPLRRGDQLLTVADETGPWVLEMRVADHDIGHVLAARKTGDQLPLRFVLATHPTMTHRGTVTRIADWTEVDDFGEPAVRVTAQIENPAGLATRPGATVTAKIHCGREKLGYVWLRDLIELVRTQVLF